MTETALTVIGSNTMIQTRPDELRFTPEQEKMIRDNYSTGATESEFKVLMEIAKARRLNPLLKQVHFVKRKDKKLNRDVWSVQVSIDGLRAIAERTRVYDGQDEPEFEYDKDGLIVLARVRVYKKGVPRPFVGVARWTEYVQTTYEGQPTKFWKDMPFTMLGKCAEALAIRKAFPEDTGGLYTEPEMQQADEPRQLPRVSPHIEPDETGEEVGDEPLSDGFRQELDAIEEMILPYLSIVKQGDREVCSVTGAYQADRDYGDVLACRDKLGSRAKQSALLKEMQVARESRRLSPEQSKMLGARWAQIDRRLAKLEALKPDAAASFSDGEP